jgi:hypothetical protein
MIYLVLALLIGLSIFFFFNLDAIHKDLKSIHQSIEYAISKMKNL